MRKYAFAVLLSVLLANPSPAQVPSGAARRLPVSARDSMEAQEAAYKAVRDSYHFTGTLAYRKMLQARVPGSIERARALIPGDEWLASLSLRFPVATAAAAASPATRSRCQASGWWCDLLQMQALLRAGEYAQADSVLDIALGSMPATVSCVWNDASSLIADRNARKTYESLPCAKRKEIDDRLWWLADPLHSIPWNERRVEHFARQVNLRLDIEARATDPRWTPGFPWGLKVARRATHLFMGSDLTPDDTGPGIDGGDTPAFWRAPAGFLSRAFDAAKYGTPRFADFYVLDRAIRLRSIGKGPSMQFVPAMIAVNSPFHSMPWDWQLHQSPAHELGFSSAGDLVELDAQHAFFTRGDSLRLVVISDHSQDLSLKRVRSSAALVLSTSPLSPRVIFNSNEGPRHQFSVLVPPDSALASVEVQTPDNQWGRVRFGVAPSQRSGSRIGVSDLALYQPDAPHTAPDEGLASILRYLLGTTRIAQGSLAGIYWEMYGLLPGEQARLQLTVSGRRTASAVRAGTRPASGREQSSFGIEWSDSPANADPIAPRGTLLDLSTLEPGWYTLELKVAVDGEPSVSTTRVIEIVAR